MADLKISELTSGGSSLATDEVPILRSGSNYRVSVAPLNVAINAQTDNYTLVSTDAHCLVTLTNAAAKNLTVPLNSSVAFPVGTQIAVHQGGAGQVTIVATGGVTINSSETLKLRTLYSTATLIKTATDTWILVGDLEEAP